MATELSEVQLTNVATKLDMADVRRDLAELREMRLMEQRLTMRLGGLMALGIGVLVALQQFGG
ncbi:MAG: hypothetical protein R3C53_19215 [Pirellulaceae bacterium]